MLEGALEDELGRYPKGAWLRNPPGSCTRAVQRGGLPPVRQDRPPRGLARTGRHIASGSKARRLLAQDLLDPGDRLVDRLLGGEAVGHDALDLGRSARS